MGRVSKRKMGKNEKQVCKKLAQVYKAGIYTRLSSNQIERKNESIDTQIEMAYQFIESFNNTHAEKIEVFEIYKDLGKTGTNFSRDEFDRLMQDIRLGDINFVIVKDLSRFGRNYLEAGNYIEKIFPFLKVRFVAVADHFDTGVDGENKQQLSMQIKNLVNDIYAKDFSAKAKIQLQQRREEGSYVGGPEPYGYKVIWVDKIRKLKPDENTKHIVQLIYGIFVDKKNYIGVVNKLNEMRVNPPSVYKKTGQVFCHEETEYKGWDKSSVVRILKSEIYVGMLAQGKSTIHGRTESNRVWNDKEDWVIRKNVHEAIIDSELKESAMKVIDEIQLHTKGNKHHSEGFPLEENIFDDVLFCGVCGRKMTRTSRVVAYADGTLKRAESYLCLAGKSSKKDVCPQSNRITKAILSDIVISSIRDEFTQYFEKPKTYVTYVESIIEDVRKQYETDFHKVEQNLAELEEEELRLYETYRFGEIKQEQFVGFKLNKREETERMKDKMLELQDCMKNVECIEKKCKNAVRSLVQLRSNADLTKTLIDTLVEKIYIYPGKRVEIIYRFTDEMMKGMVRNE